MEVIWESEVILLIWCDSLGGYRVEVERVLFFRSCCSKVLDCAFSHGAHNGLTADPSRMHLHRACECEHCYGAHHNDSGVV